MLTVGILRKAIEEAEKSSYRFKIGCVIFKGSRIISSGHNEIRSCSKILDKYKKYKNALHAEQAAIIKTDWRKLNGCSILTVKISGNMGYLGISKPCNMCYELIKHVGIKEMYYTNEHGEIIHEKI